LRCLPSSDRDAVNLLSAYLASWSYLLMVGYIRTPRHPVSVYTFVLSILFPIPFQVSFTNPKSAASPNTEPSPIAALSSFALSCCVLKSFSPNRDSSSLFIHNPNSLYNNQNSDTQNNKREPQRRSCLPSLPPPVSSVGSRSSSP
jgi:hypothetical protein